MSSNESVYNLVGHIQASERTSILFLILTIFFAMFFIIFIYSKAKRCLSLYSFILLNVLIIIWCTGLILEEFSFRQEPHFRWFALWVSYLGICFFGYAWLLFAFCFSGIKIKITKKLIFIPALPFLICYLFLLTNHFHQLFYIIPPDAKRQFGPVHKILVIISFIYIVLGIVLLVRSFLKSKGLTRSQLLFFIIVSFIIGSIVSIRIYFKWDIELIPIVVILFNYLIFYRGFKKFNLFKLVPIPIFTFTDSLEQGILIIDRDMELIRINKALKIMFPSSKLLKENETIAPFINYLRLSCDSSEDSIRLLNHIESSSKEIPNGKLHLIYPDEKTFTVIVQPLLSSSKRISGHIITFNNISKLTKLNTLLEKQNNEIFQMNKEFQKINNEIISYTKYMQELSVIKERNRILNELYSSIKICFLTMKSHVQRLIDELQTKKQIDLDKLEDLNELIKSGLQEIRSSIYMQNSDNDINNLKNNIDKFNISFVKNGVEIKILIEDEIRHTGFNERSAIFKIFQETFDNSIKHGNATVFYVIFKCDDNSFNILIMDDGKGCEEINKGNGLNNIDQIVKKLNGTVTYGSLGLDEGFNTKISIPLSDRKE